MIVGVPKELKEDEYRVAVSPAGVRELTAAGHTVYVERGAGDGSSIPDAQFVTTGATIVDDPRDIWAASDLVLGVKEPIAEEFPGSRCAPTRSSSPTSTWPRPAPAPTRWLRPATPRSPTRLCAWVTARSRC